MSSSYSIQNLICDWSKDIFSFMSRVTISLHNFLSFVSRSKFCLKAISPYPCSAKQVDKFVLLLPSDMFLSDGWGKNIALDNFLFFVALINNCIFAFFANLCSAKYLHSSFFFHVSYPFMAWKIMSFHNSSFVFRIRVLTFVWLSFAVLTVFPKP